jgi:hypothetical protein
MRPKGRSGYSASNVTLQPIGSAVHQSVNPKPLPLAQASVASIQWGTGRTSASPLTLAKPYRQRVPQQLRNGLLGSLALPCRVIVWAH